MWSTRASDTPPPDSSIRRLSWATPPLSSTSYQLPSEQRRAAADHHQQQRAVTSPGTSSTLSGSSDLLQPLPIVTTPKKSRNDLFALDWSNVTPHVASRGGTPPASAVAPSPSAPAPNVSGSSSASSSSPHGGWRRGLKLLQSTPQDASSHTNTTIGSDSTSTSNGTAPVTCDLIRPAPMILNCAPPLELNLQRPALINAPSHLQGPLHSSSSLATPTSPPRDSEFFAMYDIDRAESELNDLRIGQMNHFRSASTSSGDRAASPLLDIGSTKTPGARTVPSPLTPPAWRSLAQLAPSNSNPQQSNIAGPGPGISDNPVLDSRQAPRVRMAPFRDQSLGEGRHANVFLGSFIPREVTQHDEHHWTLCAVKRIFPDRESQIAGLGEAFILSKLVPPTTTPIPPQSIAARGSAHVLKLFGVRDERDGVELVDEDRSAVNAGARRRKWYEDSSPSSAVSIGLGRAPSMQSTHSDLIPRSSSEAVPIPILTLPRRRKQSLHRQSSFTGPSLSPPLGSPVLDHMPELYASLTVDDQGASDIHTKSKDLRQSEPPAPRPSTASPDPIVVVGDASPSAAEPRQRTRTSEGVDRIVSDASNLTQGTALTLMSSEGPGPTRPPTSRIMLLLEYCPFGHVLGFAKAFPERMSKRRWLAWATELVAAVAWTHERGVLHADIKPQNVLVASDLSIRLADFGMSMFLPSATSPHPAPTDPLGLGTPPYAPPEFVRPAPSPFGHSADIFSLGVTLSVLTTGIEPFANMRTVERMLWVGRGGYWEWEQRRRERGNDTGSASVSRRSSIRSIRSGTHSRADSGTNLSLLSSSGGCVSYLSSGRSTSSLRRSASIESERSVHSMASTSGRNSWGLAVLAKKLLSPSGGASASVHDSPASLSVLASPSPSASPSALPRSHPSNLFALPPRSPSSDDDDDLQNLSSKASHGAFESSEDEDEDDNPTMAFSGPTTYVDGTPHQYFLNGHDLVPLEIRMLLKSMTSPKEKNRPTAREVLRMLDSLET
ncbi:CAMK/CAMKL protein kinase [Microbotryum lychnidis-dioicae p1A1 Lamole]|uniref:CAMK/CAMKL protein kinase n=1 Tax=Microbotryum lychnidis-dioicae (strain p1A1 Lamole / MvSl-1064) TaxID=683840 RepID=U5H453_USTV1|nr:CAMK/CAMKL protein kinase [Microbotryum lychnidis-dioicae p1A1 Lamole]|eukprot:KDE07638.1 CAMK/CAMKL protein kinase [Microbotryum lychnidis-dioicae p1A1 Lamole]